MVTNYHIHLATDRLTDGIKKSILDLGYRKDGFIGGTKGIVRPYHFSIFFSNKEKFQLAWNSIVNRLHQCSNEEFSGYAEAEIIEDSLVQVITMKDFDESISIPFINLKHEQCPIDEHKMLDLHITVNLSTIDPRLKTIFENRIKFYYIDVKKNTGKVDRVYTCQILQSKGAKSFFLAIKEYLILTGGFEGKVKLELTHGYARFPADVTVPPILVSVPQVVQSIEVPMVVND